MLVKISMQASPLEHIDKERSIEIIRNPETFTLNDELRGHLYEVLKVFFDEDALRNFLGMDCAAKKSCACIDDNDDYFEYDEDVTTLVPVELKGKKYFISIYPTLGKRRIPVRINDKKYTLSMSLDES